MAATEKTDDILKDEREQQADVNFLDSNHHLLKKFRAVAPGSYKHTQALASIVENVGAAIDGLDLEILRLAAMYHDIGKMWSPDSFTENQGESNLHDELDPWVSYQLLTRHVSDSVAILIDHCFPMNVIRMVSQHHGNTVLMSMYERAAAKDEKVNRDLFRYHTSVPDCIESLILMLCDQVEATSRSIYVDQAHHHRNKEVEPRDLVMNIYNKLLADGQFNNVEVRLGNIHNLQTALIGDVAGSFQKRVGYNEDKDLVKKEEK